MNTLKVIFSKEGEKITGRSERSRKIIFVQRGMEALVPCFQHGVLCQVVRDTQPDNPGRGAVIVIPGKDCPGCTKEKSMSSLLPEGWKLTHQSLRSPDRVTVLVHGPEDVDLAIRRYQQRQDLVRINEMLTDEYIAVCRALLYPEGEPYVRPVEKFDNEAGNWANLSPHRQKGFHGAPLVVSLDGRIGVIGVASGGEVLSSDERGYRETGGYPVFCPLDQAEYADLRSSPEYERALEEVRSLNASFKDRKEAFERAKKAQRQEAEAWISWFGQLSQDQRLRVILEPGDHGHPKIKRPGPPGRYVSNDPTHRMVSVSCQARLGWNSCYFLSQEVKVSFNLEPRIFLNEIVAGLIYPGASLEING